LNTFGLFQHPVLIWIRLVQLYSLVLLVRAILSWIPEARSSKFYWYVHKITEPVLAPVRNIIPNIGIDISPIVIILLLNLITRVILRVFLF